MAAVTDELREPVLTEDETDKCPHELPELTERTDSDEDEVEGQERYRAEMDETEERA